MDEMAILNMMGLLFEMAILDAVVSVQRETNCAE